MKTQNDVWKYLCKSGDRSLLQFYTDNPNEVAKAFWHGVLTVLELEGKVDPEDSQNIWEEITGGKS